MNMASACQELPERPQNILQLSLEEKRIFLDSFDEVFSDIDGVVWNLDRDIEGSAEAYKELKNVGKKINFITNNSVRSMENYVKRFQALNLDVDIEDLIHPAKSIVNYLKSINFDGLIYIIATEQFKNILRDAGFKLIDGPTKILEESYLDLARHVFDREPVRAVIVDVDFNLNSAKIIRAHLYLRNPECLLIAGATDTLLPVRSDISIIGPGPFSQIVSNVGQRKMITLGKPGKELVTMIIDKFNIENPRRVLMIGDMLEQDVKFGKVAGFQTMIVLTGGCKRKDLEEETNSELIPDYYAESIADFIKFMKDLKKSNI